MFWSKFRRWIPNSPRWLLAHGRLDEVRDILIESAIVNERKHVLPTDLEYLLRQQAYNVQNEPPPAGWWTLFKGPKAIRHMICVHICWSIYIVTYYGMLLNIRSFSREHLEINTMIAGKYSVAIRLAPYSLPMYIDYKNLKKKFHSQISGACEILGVFCGLILILYTKRKWMWTGLFNIVGGLVAYTAWLIPTDRKTFLRFHSSAIFACVLVFISLFSHSLQLTTIFVWRF